MHSLLLQTSTSQYSHLWFLVSLSYCCCPWRFGQQVPTCTQNTNTVLNFVSITD